MRAPRLSFLVATISFAGPALAASFDDRVAAFFRPPVGEKIALSPDGQRVAYTLRTDRDHTIVIVDLEKPATKRTIPVEPEPGATTARDLPPPQPPTPLRFLRWATPHRLVYAPAERIAPLPPLVAPDGRSTPNPDGPTIHSPIMVTEADGKPRGLLVDAHHFQETPAEAVRSLADFLRTPQELATQRGGPVRWRMPHLDILGFHPRDREQLIVGTRGAYSMPRQHLVDLRTGHVRESGDDLPPPPGEPHVYDWFRLKVVGERQPTSRPTTTWRDEDLGRVQRELTAKFPRRIVELLDWSDTRTRVLFRVTGGSDPGRIFVFQRPEDLVLEILLHAPWLAATPLHPTRWFELNPSDGTHPSGYFTSPRQPRPASSPPPLLVLLPLDSPARALPAFDPEAQIFAELGFAVARVHLPATAGFRADDLATWRTVLDHLAVDATQPALFLTPPGHALPVEPSAELRARLGRPVEFVARDASPAATSPTARATTYRRLAERLQQRLHPYTAQTSPTGEVK